MTQHCQLVTFALVSAVVREGAENLTLVTSYWVSAGELAEGVGLTER